MLAVVVRFRVPFRVGGPESSLALETPISSPFRRCLQLWLLDVRLLCFRPARGVAKTDKSLNEHWTSWTAGPLQGLPSTLGAAQEGKSGNNRIQLAEAFPKRVCRNLAEAIWLSASEPAGGVSSVVRDSSDRIGEAANPGPPSRRKPRQSTLSNVELVEPATAKMRINIWDVFRRWVGEKLSQATLVKLFRCPPPGTSFTRQGFL